MELKYVEIVGTVVPVLEGADEIHDEETEKKFIKELEASTIGQALKEAGLVRDEVEIEDDDIESAEMRAIYTED